MTFSEVRNDATGLDLQAQDHVLEPPIAAPQRLPARFLIALAAQETAQFGDRPDEVPRRPHPMPQALEHLPFRGGGRRLPPAPSAPARPHHRNCNTRTATIASTPSIGNIASAVSNRRRSSPQPVFSTW